MNVFHRLTIRLVIAMLGVTSAAAYGAEKNAKITIELSDVPEKLDLPAPAGHNFIVTAAVHGPTPQQVWLARSAESDQRVDLAFVGDGKYQINLADDRVVLALRRTGANGQFYVFTKTADNAITQSAAVRCSVAPASAHYFVEAGDKFSREISGFPLADKNWFEPSKVQRLSATVDPTLPGLAFLAEVGDKQFEMKSTSDAAFELTVTPEIRAAWERAGVIRVSSSPSLHMPKQAFAHAIPSKLDVPKDGLKLRVRRGKAEVVPGSNEFLYFDLRDVAGDASQAYLMLCRRNASSVEDRVATDAMRVITLPSGQYVWTPTDIHPAARPADAYVDVLIVAGEPAEDRIMRHLIDRVIGETSGGGDSLVFNGKSYKHAEAADQLRRLYATAAHSGINAFLDVLETRQQEMKSDAFLYPNADSSNPVHLSKWVRDAVRKMGWELSPTSGAEPSARAR